MFLNLLTDRQKASFLALATKVVMADGDVVPEENVPLGVRVSEMGGSIKAPPEEIFGHPNTDVFDTRKAQIIVILELMVIAYSDQEYHKHEKPIIDALADAFSISAADMKRYEDWAIRQSPLSVEGWSFIDSLSN